MRDFLRKLRLGSPYSSCISDEDEEEVTQSKAEIRHMWSWVRMLEIEYGIPPRRDRKNLGNSHN